MRALARGARVALAAASAALLVLAAPLPARGDVPPGFADDLVAAVPYPTAIAFTPDGRLLVATQPGLLRVVAGGALLPTPALDLGARVCAAAERGLLGVAVDPAFGTNGFVYLFYTFNRFGSPEPCPTGTAGDTPVNRVSRFVLPPGSVIDPSSEVVILDHVPSPAGNHNAGDLQFGASGLLHVTTGDGAITPNLARDLASLSGKVLRIAPDGSVPASNPHASLPGARRCGDPAGPGPGAGPCAEVFASGLRNPYRIAFRRGSDEFHINDVGASRWEEIDLARAGADYGWNLREGPCNNFNPGDCGPPPPGITNPIYWYDHSLGCSSITGGAFVPPATWPPPYDGAYLFADLVCGKIARLVDDGAGGFTEVDFATNLGNGSVVAMAFGPDGATESLYYTDYGGNGPGGEVRKISYTGSGNRAPVAAVDATPRFGPVPLPVSFDGSASADPDGDPLVYDWDFGDGATDPGRTTPTTGHTYAVAGVWTATLVVRDGRGGVSAPATVRIDAGNRPPSPVIAVPAPGDLFAVGDRVLLTGSALDPEDGALPDSALSWEVLLHHVDELNPGNAHVHPVLGATPGNGVPVVTPAPEDLLATRLSHLEVRLTATDSWGLAATASRLFEPRRVTLALATVPAGLQLVVAGSARGAGDVVSWERHAVDVAAPVQEDAGGAAWRFSSWSDGGALAHAIVTPAADASYTATFAPAGDLALPPALLRSDDVDDLALAHALFPSLFARAGDPGLEPFGPDRRGEPGEGALLAGNGSADDDRLYAEPVAPGSGDPEAAVLADPRRPLVLYQLDQAGRVLRLTEAGGLVRVDF